MQNLDNKKLLFVKRVCDFCGSKNYRQVKVCKFLGLHFKFVKCLNCDLVYQNPLLSVKSRNHLYETREYWNGKDSIMKDHKLLNYYSYVDEENNRRKTNELRVKLITSRLPAGQKLLDLGCGDGLLVKMLENLSFKAQGMDISSEMIDVAMQKHNIKIIRGNVEKEWGFSEPFDAISCYTISNFVYPSLVFKQVQKNLRKGGYFFFNFADCDHLISRLLGRHFYAYRPSAAHVYFRKTITSVCERYGLKVKMMKKDTQIIPLARFLGLLGADSLIKGLNFMGASHWEIKVPLPTSYIAVAVRES